MRSFWIITSILAMAIPASASSIKKSLPCGSTTDLARIGQPEMEYDADGDPMRLPAVSVGVYDKASNAELLCIPTADGTIVSSEYTIPDGWRYKAHAQAWSEPGCGTGGGQSSEFSEDWYLVFVCQGPQKPKVLP